MRFILLVSALWSITSTAHGILIFGPKYKVFIEVPEHPALESELQSFIRQQQLTNESLKQLEDINKYQKLLSATLQKQMRSLGYYNFGINISVPEHKNQESDLAFLVQPGPRSMIKSIEVEQPSFLTEDLKAVVLSTQFQPGVPLIASKVIAAEQRLINHINEKYCFVKPKLSKQILMDTKTNQAEIVFSLSTDPGKNIADVRFTGNKTISNTFLKNLTKLEPTCFKSKNIRQAQVALLQSGLVNSASPTIVPAGEQVDVVFDVVERKHRTQSIGIGYSSEEEARLNFGWEHRNWRGNGKKLSTEFRISRLTTQLNGAIRVPQFKHPDFDLLIEGEVADTTLDAFDSTSAESSIGLEYQINKRWLASAGVATEYTKVKSNNSDDIFRLLSFPVSVRRDTSNDILDPTRGSIWTFSFQPFTDLVEPTIQFTRFASSFSLYLSPDLFSSNTSKAKSFTLATRLAVGSITGEPLRSVPADQRYYVGGGGSVRGFDFQFLSPRESNAIIGGLSFVEAATELRIRFTPQWGGSLFVDGGVGFEEQSPDLSARLSLGGGIGLRYMTSFAPIRIDIAWPLSSPIEFETQAQLYVGLKQAF